MSSLTHCARGALCVLLALALTDCQRTTSVAPEPAVDAATAAARAALANERSLDPRSIPPRTVGVAPLAVRVADTTLAALGYGLADLLINDLTRSSQVVVLDRVRMDAMLRELQLARSGVVDTLTAPRIGKLVGARRLVVGALSDRGGGELSIDTRLASTLDGTVTNAISARAPLASILDAERALAYRLFEELGVTLTAAERAAIDQRPTASVAGFLAYSRGVRDEAIGDFASAATNYRSALRADPGFDLARARMARAQSRVTASNGERSSKSGASSRARSAINASPIATLDGGADAAQQQGAERDRGIGAARSTITTVIVNITQ
jgi:tetratricopeptide (TPR) repeat protein